MIVSPEMALNGMTEKQHLKQCLTSSNTVKPQLSYHVNLVSEALKPRKLGRNKTDASSSQQEGDQEVPRVDETEDASHMKKE